MKEEYNAKAKQKKKQDKGQCGYEGKLDCTGQLVTVSYCFTGFVTHLKVSWSRRELDRRLRYIW